MHSWCTGSGSRHQHQMHWDSSGFATDRRHRVRQEAWTQKEGTDSKEYVHWLEYTEVIQILYMFCLVGTGEVFTEPVCLHNTVGCNDF